ncbi:helix-turn-helix domain-containing protein [Bradyrhizobium sp. ORS 86]|uniref:helix-turn-helix domain-containing protein n=1 Tax=Bradyrhizobium sp. ORS 86 TaxID=1685970 RepID=UPI003890296A
MYTWSTDQVDPRDRFDYWREGPGSGLAQHALRTGRLSLARRLIERYLSRPALSPALIADMLGISVRHMHVLFEATPTSFSQTVAALRVDRSCRLLREAPDRPIAEIAFASGFDSLATFYRAFNAVEGMSPGDYRAIQRAASIER